MLRSLLLLGILVPATAFAQDSGNDGIELSVKPVLCVTDNRNPRCELSFVVMWASESTGYYCLFNDFQDGPLRCWTEERMGGLTHERSVDESFEFWMTGDDLTNRLAAVAVEVLRLNSDDRRRRRRTRHVWDLN